MARPREFDRETALQAAMNVFWEKGYEVVSLSDLTERMGIQRPSLYAAFGDKKGLFEEALRMYNNRHAVHIRHKLQQVPVADALERLFRETISEAYDSCPSKGCFCINTLVELAPHDEKFAILTREHQMYLSVIFQAALEEGQKRGELKQELDVKAASQFLTAGWIGLTVLLKSRPDRTYAEQTAAALLHILK
ncbi:TetR/AcrR family transcriptional regulator [Paenibacillus sp. CN-4]|uniref:TetR/AcrR family transcriptional regulator n=1 Tax=Paenibacillus nanchangensis TaxID=3348343 RepID=UPI00397DE903